MNKIFTVFGGLGLIVFLVVLIAIGPLVTIWSLNTLFPVLAIPYNIWTWISIVVLTGMFRVTVTNNN